MMFIVLSKFIMSIGTMSFLYIGETNISHSFTEIHNAVTVQNI